MTGPTTYESNAQNSHENSGALLTPENYNVLDLGQAINYLVNVHGRTWLKPGEFDKNNGLHYALQLREVNRAAKYFDKDRLETNQPLVSQNVAEHSFNVALTALFETATTRQDLDKYKVQAMALLHDVIEVYADDTVVGDKEAEKTKLFRETAAMTILKHELKGNPLLGILEEYEECKTPEARYVKGRDKVEAFQFFLNNKAVAHGMSEDNFEEVVERALVSASIDHTAYGGMQAVLKQIGKKWHSWGFKEFEGDPGEIVDIYAELVQETHGKYLKALGSAATGQEVQLEEVPERPEFENVHYLDDYRRPPTPPVPPSGTALPIEATELDIAVARARRA
jgi:5'-deoxynucleotidase YfbR-like HD superfamily hydrolase